MNITILGNVWALTPPGPVRTKARQILRYRKKGFQFTPQYQNGGWDGYTRMVSQTGHFPAGLTEYLVDQLAGNGYRVGITDERIRPEPHPTISEAKVLLPLDSYQEQAVAVAYNTTRCVVEHPTGSGKGRTIGATVARLGVPTLVLVHRNVLLKQLVKDDLKKTLDIPSLIGAIGAGQDDPRPITVATFQSIASRLKNYPEPAAAMLEKFLAVIVDETHHIGGAKTYEAVMKSLTNAYYRIGFSATAHRSDDETRMRVTGWLGPIQSKMTTTEAIDTGRVVPADIYMIDPSEPHPYDLPWGEAYKSGVVRHENRNRICVELAVRLKGLSMILVERIEHGERLAQALHERGGLNFAFLDGSNPEMRREVALDRARRNELDVLIGTEILGEGVNVPAIRNLIVARAGRAPHRTIQAVGRGTRAHEDKDRILVFDFMDTDKVFRQVKGAIPRRMKVVPGPLTSQANARRKTYEAEEAYSVCNIGYEELMKWMT